MPISAGSIKLGHCYATAGGAVLKVIDFRGEMITYLIPDKLAPPNVGHAEVAYRYATDLRTRGRTRGAM